MSDEQSTIADVPSPGTRSLWRVAAYLAVLAALVLVAWPFVRTAQRAWDSEHTLHSLIRLASATEDYMRANDGSWPGSWDDLKQIPGNDRGMVQWPRDADKIAARIEMDFGVTREMLADSAFRVTSVIRPRGYYMYDPATRLEPLQRYIDERRQESSAVQMPHGP